MQKVLCWCSVDYKGNPYPSFKEVKRYTLLKIRTWAGSKPLFPHKIIELSSDAHAFQCNESAQERQLGIVVKNVSFETLGTRLFILL